MTATSRLFSLFGSSIFRHNTHPFPPSSPSLRLHLHRPSSSFSFSSSAAPTLDSITTHHTETLDSSPPHPWPEWVTFVNRLKAKGYLLQSPSGSPPATVGDDGGEIATSDDIDYKDKHILRDACLSFARDRFDIFKSLSENDIRTVVEVGCPNIYRKSVNSAKRLRAYLFLDEADACGACSLRGSCDRAYVTVKESEPAARTVDIVRMILSYALDPLVIEGGEKSSGRQLVEVSVRSLLSNLIELSETTPDPALPKPAGKVPKQKKQSADDTEDNDFSRDVEMKQGDWFCPKCNFMNFSRNRRCRECEEDAPKKVGADVEMKKGDWVCSEQNRICGLALWMLINGYRAPCHVYQCQNRTAGPNYSKNQCKFMNFSRNIRCLKCKAKGPEKVSVNDVEMKKGDWNCPQCQFMNFASNGQCKRCREPRPKRQLNPGEWECPKCDFLNYKRNMVCLKCDCERPKAVATQYEEQTWRKPHQASFQKR